MSNLRGRGLCWRPVVDDPTAVSKPVSRPPPSGNQKKPRRLFTALRGCSWGNQWVGHCRGLSGESFAFLMKGIVVAGTAPLPLWFGMLHTEMMPGTVVASLWARGGKHGDRVDVVRMAKWEERPELWLYWWVPEPTPAAALLQGPCYRKDPSCACASVFSVTCSRIHSKSIYVPFTS